MWCATIQFFLPLVPEFCEVEDESSQCEQSQCERGVRQVSLWHICVPKPQSSVRSWQ